MSREGSWTDIVCCGNPFLIAACIISHHWWHHMSTYHSHTDFDKLDCRPLFIPFCIVYLSLVHTDMLLLFHYCQLSSCFPFIFVWVSSFALFLLNFFHHVYACTSNHSKLTVFGHPQICFQQRCPLKSLYDLCKACRSWVACLWPEGMEKSVSAPPIVYGYRLFHGLPLFLQRSTSLCILVQSS